MTESPPSLGLSIGRVGRPHGLDGSFLITRPRPGVLNTGMQVTIGETACTVTGVAGTLDRPIVSIAGVGSREAALALRGQDITIARADAPPLGEGEYWAEDLVGLAVRDGAADFGQVTAMIALPSCEALEVEPGGLLVPMVADAVRRIDLDERVVDINAAFLGWEAPQA